MRRRNGQSGSSGKKEKGHSRTRLPERKRAMGDLVSVIIPVYKVEQYLERCVRSVTSQTYDNLEILLIDDGSPDRCGEMCDSFAAEDRRIRVIHQKNGGLSAARNTGIDASSGQWLFFIDSDDFIHRDCIGKLLAAAETSGADIASCGFEKTEDDTIRGDVRFPATEVISRDEAMRRLFLEEDTSFEESSFRASVFRRGGRSRTSRRRISW